MSKNNVDTKESDDASSWSKVSTKQTRKQSKTSLNTRVPSKPHTRSPLNTQSNTQSNTPSNTPSNKQSNKRQPLKPHTRTQQKEHVNRYKLKNVPVVIDTIWNSFNKTTLVSEKQDVIVCTLENSKLQNSVNFIKTKNFIIPNSQSITNTNFCFNKTDDLRNYLFDELKKFANKIDYFYSDVDNIIKLGAYPCSINIINKIRMIGCKYLVKYAFELCNRDEYDIFTESKKWCSSDEEDDQLELDGY
jgi:DNA mismatch repair ATPase MutL